MVQMTYFFLFINMELFSSILIYKIFPRWTLLDSWPNLSWLQDFFSSRIQYLPAYWIDRPLHSPASRVEGSLPFEDGGLQFLSRLVVELLEETRAVERLVHLPTKREGQR